MKWPAKRDRLVFCAIHKILFRLYRRLCLRSIQLISLVALSFSASGYSLLTHEQIIDIVWKDHLQPLLLSRFPDATAQQLRQAHAYAYGGSLIQDIGYYPFGDEFFSDLTHYVRSGDFVMNLIRESDNIYEYAFALGALAHYSSDVTAHPTVNHAVALSYPKLRARFGDSVTYEDNPKAHIRVEFGFDMVQVAKGRYTSESYRDFIGFAVSKPVLQRAMLKTYGLNLEETLGPVDLAIGTFRRAVSEVIPKMTHVALVARRPEIVRDVQNFDQKKFLFNLSRSEYEREWGKEYRRPRFGARVMAILLHMIPKIGPFQALAFKIPSTETEDLYFKSVNKAVDNYQALLHKAGQGQLDLPDLNCDTAGRTRAGNYALSDAAYAKLLDLLSKHPLEEVRPDLRDNILAYYAKGGPPKRTRKERKAWCKTVDELWSLQAVQPASDPRQNPRH